MKKTAVDLFCGAGGLSEGFRQAGFHVLAGNDIEIAAGKTYAATHDEARFLTGPIQAITANDMMSAAGLVPGELDVLIGGPPCQAYSVYNHQRGTHDKRADLFREYLRLVEGMQPKWVVMENVTGIIGRRKAIFVHGCFWHQHDDPECTVGHAPKSCLSYWGPKLQRNKDRDAKNIEGLLSDGWDVLVIWECQTRDPGSLTEKLKSFLSA